jgi:hypothetical protein
MEKKSKETPENSREEYQGNVTQVLPSEGFMT